jgi:hypothetical protein
MRDAIRRNHSTRRRYNVVVRATGNACLSLKEQIEQMATIRDLMTIADYAKRAAPVLPTAESVRWVIRQHGRRLQASGAIVKLGGHLWINPLVMDELVLQIAQEVAANANTSTMN